MTKITSFFRPKPNIGKKTTIASSSSLQAQKRKVNAQQSVVDDDVSTIVIDHEDVGNKNDIIHNDENNSSKVMNVVDNKSVITTKRMKRNEVVELSPTVLELLLYFNRKEQNQQQQHNVHDVDDDASNPTVGEDNQNSNTPNTSSTKQDDNDNDTDKSNWYQVLKKHFHSNSFQQLATFLSMERNKNGCPIYPPVQHTWTALNECPLHLVKVVIVGQDPYHGPNQAHGLCFSVLPQIRPLPPSLGNIYKEIIQDIHLPMELKFINKPGHGHLVRWSQQGVLLLNTVLTVRKGQPNSHQKKGWEEVTDAIIDAVLQYHTNSSSSTTTTTTTKEGNHTSHQQRRQGVVFLLWGKPAYQKATNVIQKYHHNKNHKNNNKIVVINTSHPSPLGATKTSTPFLTSHCFSRCNTALVEMGHEPINWNI